jgi:hypothetical protein
VIDDCARAFVPGYSVLPVSKGLISIPCTEQGIAMFAGFSAAHGRYWDVLRISCKTRIGSIGRFEARLCSTKLSVIVHCNQTLG